VRDLSGIVKAYDVRGVVPDELDGSVAQAIGAAFADVSGALEVGAIVVGYDMRPSSPELAAEFAFGANSLGVEVIDIGLASTDELYFASGHLDLPGAMFTASHNPARYNGIKMCRAGATPIGQESGLARIRELAEADGGPGTPAMLAHTRSVEKRDLLPEYVRFLRSLVDIDQIRPLTVVVDAGNGMGGLTVPAVLADSPVRLVPMYFELDGTFPHHEANPIEPANLRDLQARVLAEKADLGLAFDGDADRCFAVDERGEVVNPSTITALIAARELAREPGSTILYNLITSRAVPEIVAENGGTAIRTRVGHSFIKARMAETNAIFGGEHSGHFYFRDFWRADSGMLAALHVIAALGATAPGATCSSLLAPFERYVSSGEINTVVADQVAVMRRVRAAFEGRNDVRFDELDGLTIDGDEWWINVRPSNTEPLLRLNVEAPNDARMSELRDEALTIIRSEDA
jgi:phosphomannomutase